MNIKLRSGLASHVSGLVSNITHNLWGLDLDGTMQGAGGVGGLLAVVRDGETYIPTYDANGNISEYIDSSDGTIAAHYDYSPFGETLVASGPLASTFTHRFSTKPWCSETKLLEYQMRKYHPEIGRWVSRDSIEESCEVNLYAFCLNTGVCAIDFRGNIAVEFWSWEKTTFLGFSNFGFKETIVKSVDDIQVEERTSNSQYGGGDFLSIEADEGLCTVKILLKIYVSKNSPKAVGKDFKFIYHPHTILSGNLAGGYTKMENSSNKTTQPPFGAILAHEKGHANAYLEHTKPMFEQLVEKIPAPLTTATANLVKRLYKDSIRKTRQYSADGANQATLTWLHDNNYSVEKKDEYYVGTKK